MCDMKRVSKAKPFLWRSFLFHFNIERQKLFTRNIKKKKGRAIKKYKYMIIIKNKNVIL